MKVTEINNPNALDISDTVSTKLTQRHALLASMSGEGFDTFTTLAQEEQANLLWLATDPVRNARQTFGQIEFGTHLEKY